MSSLNTLGWAAAGLYVGNKLGNKIKQHIEGKQAEEAINNLHADLTEKYGAAIAFDVVTKVRELHQQGADMDIGAILADVFQKRLYRTTFSLYGEDAADFVLAKWKKYQEMNLDFDPNDAIRDYAEKHPGAGIEITKNLALEIYGISELEANTSASTRAAYTKWKAAADEEIIYGRLPTEGIVSKKRYIFHGRAFPSLEEAQAEKDQYVQSLLTKEVEQYIGELGVSADEAQNSVQPSKIQELMEAEIVYGREPHESFLEKKKYRILGKTFETRELAEMYRTEEIQRLQEMASSALTSKTPQQHDAPPSSMQFGSGFEWTLDPDDSVEMVGDIHVLMKKGGRHIVFGYRDFDVVAELDNLDGDHFIYLMAASGDEMVEVSFSPKQDNDSGVIPISFTNLSKSEAGWYAQQFLSAMKDDRVNKGWVDPERLEYWINKELSVPQPTVPRRAIVELSGEVELPSDNGEKVVLSLGRYELKRRATERDTGYARRIELEGEGGDAYMDQDVFEEISRKGLLRILEVTDKS